MERQVTVNKEQELYVIPASHGGYSCLGFEYAEKRRRAVLEWIGEPVEPVETGTLEAYYAYHNAMMAGFVHHDVTGERCNAELVPELVRHEGRRVEIVDCYGETRRFIVGKSSGWMPCHLEIKRRSSTGGVAVSGAPFKSIRVIE